MKFFIYFNIPFSWFFSQTFDDKGGKQILIEHGRVSRVSNKNWNVKKEDLFDTVKIWKDGKETEVCARQLKSKDMRNVEFEGAEGIELIVSIFESLFLLGNHLNMRDVR